MDSLSLREGGLELLRQSVQLLSEGQPLKVMQLSTQALYSSFQWLLQENGALKTAETCTQDAFDALALISGFPDIEHERMSTGHLFIKPDAVEAAIAPLEALDQALSARPAIAH